MSVGEVQHLVPTAAAHFPPLPSSESLPLGFSHVISLEKSPFNEGRRFSLSRRRKAARDPH